ncbi:MAG TPA: transketolase [Clostridiaceae bacterium]|nr:transketolase [Clostridiaceae bacterium]
MVMDKASFEEKSKEIRRLTIECIGNLGVGHIGGCLSIVDVLTVLYYSQMNVDPANPKMEGRDRLIISKGHAGPALYATLASKGFFPKDELYTLNRLGTNLPSHCDMNKTPGVDMTTGALGQGFSCAVGIAIGSKIKKDGAYIYTIIGDGESQEGQIWEAAMLAAHKKLDNLIAFTDYNKLQIDGPIDEVNSLSDLPAKWESFGWHVQRIDGHDHFAIYEAIEKAKKTEGKPSMIILDTIKGKGVSFIEAVGAGNHNMPITKEQLEAALQELR